MSDPQINLMHGDCLELMALIPDNSVDAIVCDLPYALTGNRWDTLIPFEPLWAAYKRVIKPNGAIVLTAAQPFTTALIASNYKDFRYCWVWEKNRPTGFNNAKRRPLKATEDVVVFNATAYNPQGLRPCGKVIHNTKHKTTKGAALSSQTGGTYQASYMQVFTGYPRNVLKFSFEVGLHNTQKPVALIEYLIRTYSSPGDLVLDNCMGSGTAAIACIQSGRRFIGIEKDADYFAAAVQRVHDTHRNLFTQEAYDAESIDALAA